MSDRATKVNVRATVQSVFDRLKQEISESARNALLSDLHDQLSQMNHRCAMNDDGRTIEFGNGFMACWSELRAWMVSQSATGDHTP